MLNKAILQGRLVADPELRHTQQGTAVAQVRIAVDRGHKDKDTGRREADFFNIVAWRGTGELMAKWFHKGQMMVVDGAIRNREYTDKDGNRRYATDIVAERIHFCDSAKKDDQPSGGWGAPPTGAAPGFSELSGSDGELPF